MRFIHSFIQEFIRRPFKKSTQRRPQPSHGDTDHAVLSNLQNALSLFLGRIRISKGSPFQVEGPTMENARRCLVAVRVNSLIFLHVFKKKFGIIITKKLRDSVVSLYRL